MIKHSGRTALSVGLLGLFLLAACQPPEPLQTRFAVPGEGLRQFLDLPWPSDIDRRDEGGLDLRQIPNPTQADILEDYLGYVATVPGYALTGAVYFDMGAVIDASTLPESAAASRGDGASVQLIDVDPDSPERGQRIPVRTKVYANDDLYVQAGALAVMPVLGYVLRPATTYAVVVTDAVRTTDGSSWTAPGDLAALLAKEAPSEPAKRRAHELFAPLRDQWRSEGHSADTIVHATVFTTQHPTEMMERLAADIRQRNSAVIESLREADDYDLHPHYFVYEGELTLDQYQRGTPPFEDVGMGGFELGPDGLPVVQRRETMPFALTVPREPVPPGGWPVALVAHGTGGWWRGFVGDREGDEATFLARAGFAALGVSQPLHRGREGYVEDLEGLNSVNIVNPPAAIGNGLQGGLETVMLARYLRDGYFPIGAGARRIPIDPSKTAFFGHSQGGYSGTLALGLDRDIRTAVISGAGGAFAISMLEKMTPVEVMPILRTFLSLPEDYVADMFHPITTVMQTWLEVIDPLNYARLVYQAGPDRVPPAVLVTSGWVDTCVPVVTHAPLGAAYGVPPVEPLVEMPEVYELMGMEAWDSPARDNVSARGRQVTGGLVQYHADPGHDGHFVVFQHAEATRTVRNFFLTARGQGAVINP